MDLFFGENLDKREKVIESGEAAKVTNSEKRVWLGGSGVKIPLFIVTSLLNGP